MRRTKRELDGFIAGYRQEVSDPRFETVGAHWRFSEGYKAGREAARGDLARRAELIADHRDCGLSGIFDLGLYELPDDAVVRGEAAA